MPQSCPSRAEDHLALLDPVFFRELPVALVVCRHRHDGAGAVTHQHKVGGKDRHRLAGDRVQRVDTQRHTLLFHGLEFGLADPAAAAFVNEIGQRRIVGRGLHGQRVFGGDSDIGHTHQGVGPGGIDLEPLGRALDTELHLHAQRAADPVALHGHDLFGPARQLVEVVQQFLGIVGDADEPLLDIAFFDRCAGAPALAVDHLLVGQHGLVNRVPVDRRGLAIGQALVDQAGEQPLLPAVVVGIAGRQFAVPVIAETQTVQLSAHVGDVGVGPFCGGFGVLDRGIFRRQAKGVPTHRLQHVFAQQALIARNHVANRVVAHMPHVQLAAGVGKHRETVEFLPLRVLGGLERGVFFPECLGGILDLFWLVLRVHGWLVVETERQSAEHTAGRAVARRIGVRLAHGWRRNGGVFCHLRQK